MSRETTDSFNSPFAERDFLTGAFTRSYLQPDFSGDCTLIDLIGLGAANTRSYSQGDAFIRIAAKKMMAYGPVVRLGGDEFLILGRGLPELESGSDTQLEFRIAVGSKKLEETWADFIDGLWVMILELKQNGGNSAPAERASSE